MFDADTYAARRSRLVDALDAGGLCLFLGNTESPRNAAANPYPFRQDSSFLYFWGLDRPGLAATLDLDAGTETLFGDDPSLDEIVWTGPQPSLNAQAERVGVAATALRDRLADAVHAALEAGRPVHLLPPYRAAHRETLAALLEVPPAALAGHVSEPFTYAVIEQRLRKSEAEIAALDDAATLTNDMHEHAMRSVAPGATEQDIVGALTSVMRRQGGRFSFLPICSVRGEVLHNHAHDNTLCKGDLLLVDAGAETAAGYAGDVTRVTPVGGRFSSRQRDVYTAVLDAQTAAIDMMAPGVPFRAVHLEAAQVLTERLIDLGLMRGPVEDAVDAGAHALFFPHGLGHLLGLDVHDMEALGEDRVGYADGQSRSEQFGLNALRLARPLEPGFVVTVEPGLYFIPTLIEQWAADGKHSAFIDYDAVQSFMDFGGIRIEDDVLVTPNGTRTLGNGLAKAPDDVEALAGMPARS